MSYYNSDFLLKSEQAKILYHEFAEKAPIFDYHCHLSEKELLADKPFENISQMWLGGDHYKWRLMRSFGIDEKFITGDSSDKEKFVAYLTAIETAFDNPLYHWSQLELEEAFHCHRELNRKNADAIWEETSAYIKDNHLKPSDLVKSSNVKIIFTTNEAFDDLSTFPLLKEKFSEFEVYPAFRADKILNIHADDYLVSIEKLSALTKPVTDLASMEYAIETRLQEFIKVGCKASDVAPEKITAIPTKERADEIFKKKLSGETLSVEETDSFKGYTVYFLMSLFAKYHIATELHLGATRNNNRKMFEKLGADAGFDAVSSADSCNELATLLNRLSYENNLPKTVLFTLNPKLYTTLPVLMGCYQDESAKGKMQFGAAWWFNDHKNGMIEHLKNLSATAHLGTYIGMLTDSRSFLSYQRHYYFRRILCNYLGGLMADGEMTADMQLVGKVVEDISFNNAKNYFGV